MVTADRQKLAGDLPSFLTQTANYRRSITVRLKRKVNIGDDRTISRRLIGVSVSVHAVIFSGTLAAAAEKFPLTYILM